MPHQTPKQIGELLCEAAQNGTLTHYPHLLTAQNLTLKNEDGNTPIHEAAYHGHLDQIPPPLLTQENIRIENESYNTPLHRAAYHGHLDQIPLPLLTEENLTLENPLTEDSPLRIAVDNGYIHQIPWEIFRNPATYEKFKDRLPESHLQQLTGWRADR